MDLSPINDFFSNIKDKLTNPFFGTLIIVWLTRNWELVYSVFNFDNNLKLSDKVKFIENYFAAKNFWLELCINVGLAVLFMVIGYLLIIVTRSLSIIVEHNIMPLITNKLINKNVVLKTDYDIVVKERDDYFEKYENERRSIRALSDDYDNLQTNYKKSVDNFSNITTKFESLNKKHDSLLTIEEFNKNKVSKLEDLSIAKDKVIDVLEQIKANTFNLEFDDYTSKILNNVIYSNNDYQNFVIKSLKSDNKLNKTIPKNLSEFKSHFTNLIHLFELGNFADKQTDDYLILNEEGIKLLKFIKIVLSLSKNEHN